MKLLEKINKLNELCDNSLSITCYGDTWNCNSYTTGTPLNQTDGGSIEGETFTEMIDNALEYIENHKNYIVIGTKKYRLVEEK